MHIFGQTVDEHLYEGVHLLFCHLEDCINAFKHRFEEELQRFGKSDISQLIREIEENLPKGAKVFIFALFQSNHHVAYKHDRHMGSKCVIRKTVALTDKLQVGFAGFEEYLDLLQSFLFFLFRTQTILAGIF